jgi:hypothetical protein
MQKRRSGQGEEIDLGSAKRRTIDGLEAPAGLEVFIQTDGKTAGVAPSPARSKAALALASLFGGSGQPTDEVSVESIAPVPAVSSTSSTDQTENARPQRKPERKTWSVEELGGSKAPTGDYSRRDKSLGLLCSNFVQTYGKFPAEPQSISLDKVAEQLGVERRRIYDIGACCQQQLNLTSNFKHYHFTCVL